MAAQIAELVEGGCAAVGVVISDVLHCLRAVSVAGASSLSGTRVMIRIWVNWNDQEN